MVDFTTLHPIDFDRNLFHFLSIMFADFRIIYVFCGFAINARRTGLVVDSIISSIATVNRLKMQPAY